MKDRCVLEGADVSADTAATPSVIIGLVKESSFSAGRVDCSYRVARGGENRKREERHISRCQRASDEDS